MSNIVKPILVKENGTSGQAMGPCWNNGYSNNNLNTIYFTFQLPDQQRGLGAEKLVNYIPVNKQKSATTENVGKHLDCSVKHEIWGLVKVFVQKQLEKLASDIHATM